VLNRKKLIQLALSEIPSETEYLDYKQEINLTSESSRGKLIRIICAMSNSTPNSKSFILVGISDNKELVGSSFIDDADFQNSVKDYLPLSLKISYENVKFTELPENRFIGVITIYPTENICSISKSIWKIRRGDKYVRRGSTTEKWDGTSKYNSEHNSIESDQLVKRATISLESTLDSVLDFYSDACEDYNPKHYVFNDQHIVGITAWPDKKSNLFSEVTVSLLNEEIIYFWSALEYVELQLTKQSVTINENALLFWNSERLYMPLKTVIMDFSNTSSYQIDRKINSRIPHIDKSEIDNFLNSYIEKLESDCYYLKIFPYELLLAALNGSKDAAELLLNKNNGDIDGSVAESYTEAITTFDLLKDRVKFS
jgi:hypothetical protein